PRKAGATRDPRGLYYVRRNIVSILTGPERPVQLDQEAVAVTDGFGFNPHRPRKAGATAIQGALVELIRGFNPHRPRKAGATMRAVGDFAALLPGFNPHRPRKAGATPRGGMPPITALSRGFNPHRPRKAGATVISCSE